MRVGNFSLDFLFAIVHFECIIAFKAARTVVKLFKKLDPGHAQET
jgi:hypothetical protein